MFGKCDAVSDGYDNLLCEIKQYVLVTNLMRGLARNEAHAQTYSIASSAHSKQTGGRRVSLFRQAFAKLGEVAREDFRQPLRKLRSRQHVIAARILRAANQLCLDVRHETDNRHLAQLWPRLEEFDHAERVEALGVQVYKNERREVSSNNLL